MFFIVYSITDRSSFEEAERIGRFIKDSLHRETVDMVIVANKCDLDHLRRVTSDEGCELATELNCNFYEVSTSEDCKQVREVVKTSLLNFIRHREKLRETGNLKVPSFVKRTPSFEKRKRSGRNSQDNLKTVVTTFEIRQRMRLKEEGDGYDDKANNNNAQGVYGKQSDNGGKDLVTPSKAINNESSKNRPFHVEKIKNASQSRDRQKVTSSTDKSPVISNDEKPKIPFTVHKVKGSSASEWMRPLPVDKLRPLPNYWIRTEQTVCEEKPKKGPFSLDRRRNHDQSTEKLNRASSSNERSRSTSSFTRMKDGLIGRTKALRRKPIYLWPFN